MTVKLVICCDGTWNRPDQKDRGRVAPSNVVKMARAVKRLPNQHVYYDEGVGAGEKWLDRLVGGAFGTGITQNILQAYLELAHRYEEGAEIYLFGFSRGAYTVRSLAGLIGASGLWRGAGPREAMRAYDAYRARDERARAALLDQAEVCRPAIHFIGVWDTVGALGVPKFSRYSVARRVARALGSKTLGQGFHDVTLGDNVRHAYHAVAIDERRPPYTPTLWRAQPGRENVQQVWFAGTHSNVGGGYVDAGLSDHALMWMVVHAQRAGLAMDERYLRLRVDPNYHGELRESLRGIFALFGPDPRRLFATTPDGAPRHLNEAVHYSAVDRRDHETERAYAPANLPPTAELRQAGRVVYDGERQITIARRAWDGEPLFPTESGVPGVPAPGASGRAEAEPG